MAEIVRTSQSEGYTEDSENTPESFTGATSQAEEQIDTTLGEDENGSVPTGETPVATQPESEFIVPNASPSERILRRLADKFHDRADRIEAKNLQDAVYATYEPNLQKTAEREQSEQVAAKEAARDARRQEREATSAERKEAVRNVLRGIGSMAKRAYNRTKEIAGVAAFGVGAVGSIAAEAVGNKLSQAKEATAERAAEMRQSFAEKRQAAKDKRSEAKTNRDKRRADNEEARQLKREERKQALIKRGKDRKQERIQKHIDNLNARLEAEKNKKIHAAERQDVWAGRREAVRDVMIGTPLELSKRAAARSRQIGRAGITAAARGAQRTGGAASGAVRGAVEGWKNA